MKPDLYVRSDPRERYRRIAASYDRRLGLGRLLHDRAIKRLAAQPGETIIDVGCGTGLAFAGIEAAIGSTGALVGVEPSPEMAEIARNRIRAAGWENVTMIVDSAEDAGIPKLADAAMFLLTHDVMRSPQALENVVSSMRPGGRAVAAGSKLAHPLLVPLNAYVRLKARRYVSTFDGLRHPWSHLEGMLDEFHVRSLFCGAAYVASGRVRG